MFVSSLKDFRVVSKQQRNADFYSGSFTTAEVCKDLKRNFIGCDINPNCFEKAKERGLFSFTDLPTKLD